MAFELNISREDRVPMVNTAPPEDRTYLYFLVAGFVVALAGGFVLAVVAPLAAIGTLPYEDRSQLLVQAHGWAQLLGFAGLIVAGMALRLVPRFAGTAPPSRPLAFSALGLLAVSAIVRMLGQPWLDGQAGDAALAGAGVAGSLGMLLVAGLLWTTVSRGRRGAQPWNDFARAGAVWWVVWGAFSTYAALKAVDNGRYVPLRIEDGAAWVAMLGVIGSFVWAVQSRSVPVFFGRKPPRRRQTLIPFVLLNAGLLLLTASVFLSEGAGSWRVEGLGLTLAGVGLVALPPIAGSVWGRATRLRPRARNAGRYILVANWSAMFAGALLAWAGLVTLDGAQFEAFWARDAARHALGLGTITILIVGMAQLVAPVFALERAGTRRMSFRDGAVFWLLAAALVTRVSAGLLADVTSYDLRMRHAAYAGALAWIALVLFAWRLIDAIRREPEMKALLGFDDTLTQGPAGAREIARRRH